MEIANPVTRILLAWTALAALAAFFILHANIHPMDVVTLSQGKQDTIAKNNLRRITLKPVWAINSFTLYALYCHQISSSIKSSLMNVYLNQECQNNSISLTTHSDWLVKLRIFVWYLPLTNTGKNVVPVCIRDKRKNHPN